MTVRVRIAPSPTGSLHVGNARSALFNWLFARNQGGTFVLRIDDTDRERSTSESEEAIKDDLRWLGLDWDEGVDVGGPHGTYRQSDRFDRYREVAASLVEAGHAYYETRSSEELEERRRRAQKEGKPHGFYIRRPESADVPQGARLPIRFAVPPAGAVEFHDLVRDEMTFDHSQVDDFVILRSDGSPTYHLASTVDDVDYQITHVVRGEDLLSSTPKHILLTRAIGAESPTYAHLPLLFGPDGKKLSKRHGDTSVRAFRDHGFLAEAMWNYLALLGWSYEAETTIFTSKQAVPVFDLDDVSKNPAVFDPDKLMWMSGEYMRAMPAAEWSERARERLAQDRPGFGDAEWDLVAPIAELIQERIKVWEELEPMCRFLLDEEISYDERSWSKVMKPDTAGPVLSQAVKRFSEVTWDADSIEASLRALLEELELNARKGLQPVRVAITGSQVSPPLFESLEALGRERVLARLTVARQRLELAQS